MTVTTAELYSLDSATLRATADIWPELKDQLSKPTKDLGQPKIFWQEMKTFFHACKRLSGRTENADSPVSK